MKFLGYEIKKMLPDRTREDRRKEEFDAEILRCMHEVTVEALVYGRAAAIFSFEDGFLKVSKAKINE